jgi:hypothetical protein
LPHIKLDSSYVKHRLPHIKLHLCHLKLHLPHLKFNLPQMKWTLPWSKRLTYGLIKEPSQSQKILTTRNWRNRRVR